MKSKTLPTLLIALLSGSLFVPVAGAATDVTWQEVTMSQSGNSIITNGTLAYAWCQSNGGSAVTNTVNGVPFVGRQDLAGCADFGLSGEWLWDLDGTAPDGVSGAWSNLLQHGWWGTQGEHELRLGNLTPGATYLVQFVLCSQKSGYGGAPGDCKVVAPGDGSVWARPRGYFFTYGGSLAATFTAENATESFTLRYEESSAFFNAIQVRKLISGSYPTIGSVSAVASRKNATITLSDVGMGSDEDGNPATKYSVSYSLNGADPVTVLRDQTAETVSFVIPNLADGDYVCSVTISSDKGKTSLPASVSFEIFAQEGNFNALKAAIEGASDGDTIVVNRGIYAATSTINVTAANVTVVSRDGKRKTILDGGTTNRLFQVSGRGFAVRGVSFKNCHSAQGGGAIKLDGAAVVSSATIADCDFVGCTARFGGAIYALDETHADFGARSDYGLVDGCSFVRCGTSWTDMWNAGGAIYGSLWIENSAFDACYVEPTAPSRGQTAVAATSHATVSNCVFRNQTLCSNGGGLAGTSFSSNNNDYPNAAVRLVGCTIAGNVLDSSNAGLFYGRAWVDRCVVSNTTTTINTSSSGNNLPSFFRSPDASVTKVTSTLFIDNKFPFKLGSIPSLANCTFVQNVGGLAYFQGDSSVPAITNCVFWGNLPKADGWPWNRSYKGAPGLYWCENPENDNPLLPSVIQIANTVVEGGSTNAVAAVLACDPSGASARITAACDEKGVRFAKPDKGDWSPRAKSPLRDAGVLCDWMAGARDFLGKRPRDFGGGPDVGCFEHYGEPPTILVLR